MKHILNDLSEQEKNSIREQHTGGMKVMTEGFSKLINSKLGDVKPILSEQQINFRVVGNKYERPSELEYGRPPVMVILRVKDWGSGEVFLEVEEQGNDLKTVFDNAIKKFESKKSSLNIQYPGIEKVQPPTIDKLISK
jgi:hypothetical protein